MPTYEINLWQDKKIIEKVVKQFDKDEDVLKFIHEHFDDDEELPRLDQEKGYLRPKKTSIIITRKAYGPNPKAKGYYDHK